MLHMIGNFDMTMVTTCMYRGGAESIFSIIHANRFCIKNT